MLIDDRPDITGAVEPDWEHILYSEPYNLNITDKRRIDRWSEWREVLGAEL